MKTMTGNVATWKVPDVERKIDALNKKARKLGLPGVTMEKGEGFTTTHAADCRCCAGLRSDAWTPVTVSGEAVRIDGWQLVAVLDHGIGDKPVIRSVGDDVPERYRNARPICDHCGLERRRRDTFVLEKDGEFKQVGRTCLGDYLGENTAQAIVAYAAWIGQLGRMMDKWRDPDDPYGPRGREEARWNLEGFLEYTAIEIRENGWVSRSQANNDFGALATADAVLLTLCEEKDREEAEHQIMDETKAEAEAAVVWASEVEADNDYMHNIRVIAKAGWTNARNAGFAASILTAYRRQVERKVKAKLDVKSSGNAGYFGEPGKRLRGVEVTVVSLREIAGNYGPTTIVKMRTAEGHNLTWFASGHQNLDAGGSFTVDLTVKGHELYQGVMQTRVNRMRVLSGA